MYETKIRNGTLPISWKLIAVASIKLSSSNADVLFLDYENGGLASALKEFKCVGSIDTKEHAPQNYYWYSVNIKSNKQQLYKLACDLYSLGYSNLFNMLGRAHKAK